MKGKQNCWLCNGTGQYLMEGDLHNSEGMVPCRHDPDKKKKKESPNTIGYLIKYGWLK